MRVLKLVLSMHVAVLFLLLSLQFASADISIDKQVAHIGDLVHIKITPALQDQTMVIITPKSTYRFIGGMPENAAFVPDAIGVYAIRIIDNNELVDSSSFTVVDAGTQTSLAREEAKTLLVSAEQVGIGEPIIIDAPVTNVQAIGVHDGEEYQYMDAVRPITFIPQHAGTLTVWMRYMNGTNITRTVTVGSVNPLVETAPPAEPTPSVTLQEGTAVRQTTPELLEVSSAKPGRYDVDLKDMSRSLKRVSFAGLSYDANTQFKVRDVLPEEIKGNKPEGIVDAFAIDPSNLNYSSASFSFTAVGIALYKCTEYDYTLNSCYGENSKVMDLAPGTTYTLPLTKEDPLFSQTGYLANPGFTSTGAGWTNLSEGVDPITFAITNDTLNDGSGEMTITGANKNGSGSYYQTFNLTIPTGTTLVGLNFSAMWRVPTFNSQAGNIYLWVQDAAHNNTYCQNTTAFSTNTSWVALNVSAPNSCPLGNFTANTNYTFRLRCNLNTGSGGSSTEVCRWDNASVTVWYNDTTAPTMRNATETPDPVNYNQTLNITVNVTDNIAVDQVLVEISGANYSMRNGPGNLYSFDGFNTSRAIGVYTYKLFFNDTNNNRVTNASTALNFTIRDVNPPLITLIAPANNSYTTASSFVAQYNLSDEAAVSNCTLNVSGINRNSTLNPSLGATLNLTGPLATDGVYAWNITCNDTSNNRNTSETRTITKDTIAPVAFLNLTNSTNTSNTTVWFSVTPIDVNLKNCSLWGNFTGSWALNKTNTTLTSGAAGLLNTTLTQGVYLWNMQCYDQAGNSAFNQTNFTLRVDTTAPRYSAESIAPATSSIYASGAFYQFNMTWTDAETVVDTVLFETNLSGTLANFSTVRSGSTYSYNTTDRPAGSYSYRWFANDSAGNTNSTAVATYTIAQASPLLNLTLNGTYANFSVEVNEFVNATGMLLTPSAGNLELYLDSARVNTSQNRVTNITQILQERRYNVTLIYNATQNYTGSFLTLFVDVVDRTPPNVSLGNPANNSVLGENVTFFFTPDDNVEIGNCTIVLDGTLNETKDVFRRQVGNITVTGIADGVHNWTVNCSDTSNLSAINTSYRYFTVDTQPPAAFTLYSPASGTMSSTLSPVFLWNQTSDSTFDRYTILVDNDVNFGSVNYQANTSPVPNRSMQFTVLDQTVWYWKVIAYDQAGNQRSSSVFNYTADAAAPVVSLNTPTNNSFTNASSVVLQYTVSDLTPLANCSLYINGTLNQTNTSVSAGTSSFTVPVAERSYAWYVTCSDTPANIGSSIERSFTVDRTAPSSFALGGIPDNALLNNPQPIYTWNSSSDAYFASYAVEVSDNGSFPYANYTFTTTNSSNTSIIQTPALADGVWYWRVIAHDQAGNNRTVHPTFTIDTTPPSAFDLVSPANGTELRNTTPLFQWQQSTDVNFANYTLLVSDNPDFLWVNYTNSTAASAQVSAQIVLAQNVIWYWKVIAYDQAGNSRNSTSSWVYTPDFLSPIVTQVSPATNTVQTTSSLVQFKYNVTDIGTIANCSLYINDTFVKLVSTPTKNTTQTISSNLENGFYNWTIGCTDNAGNSANSSTRNITLNVIVPTQLFYETNTVNGAATMQIQLNNSFDATENSVSFSVNTGTVATAVNATHTLNGSGMILYNNTQVNFSGSFSQSNNNAFFVTWKLYKVNTTSSTLLCQNGSDDATGTAIGTTTKKTLNASCSYTNGDLRFNSGDNITLTVDLFNSGGAARTFTHFWDGVSNTSNIMFKAYKLGVMNVSFVNATNPGVSEDGSYVEQCNATCLDGSCLSTDVYAQLWNGTVWLNFSTTGNLTLNSSQLNPVSLGNINSSNLTNFSLYGSLHSINNTIRCYAESTYSTNTSALKNVSVIDRLAPTVSLSNPSNASAFEPQSVTFQYISFDKRLANCSLWGNWSGTWKLNQTQVPMNNTLNSFTPIFLDYGIYSWNVQCNDSATNSAFAANNYTLYIAGDVAVASGNITFSTNAPTEGQNITIFANITNRANRPESSVTVQFWRGVPGVGTQLGGDQVISLSALSYKTVNATWIAEIGTHQMYVTIDPAGTIIESDEGNNVANRSVFIPMWQVYYGNVSGNVTLGTSANATFQSWSFINQSGNIFITDSDTKNGVNFAFLKALGTNTTGGINANTLDDFAELDGIINTTIFNDSVNSTYTAGGSPITASTYRIFGNTIGNVPVNESSTNFRTGILWDSDDSSNSYYDGADKEDVVFVTAIQNMSASPNGIVDYEIKTPSRLKNYRGATATVSFYYELQ